MIKKLRTAMKAIAISTTLAGGADAQNQITENDILNKISEGIHNYIQVNRIARESYSRTKRFGQHEQDQEARAWNRYLIDFNNAAYTNAFQNAKFNKSKQLFCGVKALRNSTIMLENSKRMFNNTAFSLRNIVRERQKIENLQNEILENFPVTSTTCNWNKLRKELRNKI